VRPAEAASRPDLRVPDLRLPQAFYRNGTVFLHVLAAQQGGHEAATLRHEVVRITRYVLQKDRRVPTRHLLTESTEEEAQPQAPAKPLASLPRAVEVGFVQELRPLQEEGLESKGLSRYVRGRQIQLPLYVNTLVSPRDEYAPLIAGNGSADGAAGEPLRLELRFRNIGLAYWTMQLQVGLAFDEAERTMGLNEYDVDSFKQMIGGSSPVKILLVYSIAILHLVFEYLAFSSDINFWRKKTSFEGLSSSSVMMQACMNVIMFLYVKEQQQTKFVMYFISFRFCLNLWKLNKLTRLEMRRSWPFLRWVPREGASSSLEELQEITSAERKCMGWLMLLLLPAIAAFCVYRLISQKFRSWYSWIVLSLAVCAQMGGFVVMTPQVFMNYRLKSVEHLPWRVLTYQAINTFIDDVFVLCIRMPEVQKYSVFRDDIVFVICCIQRCLYRKKQDVADARPKEE